MWVFITGLILVSNEAALIPTIFPVWALPHKYRLHGLGFGHPTHYGGSMKYRIVRDGEYRDDAAIDVTGVARRDASSSGAAATWS